MPVSPTMPVPGHHKKGGHSEQVILDGSQGRYLFGAGLAAPCVTFRGAKRAAYLPREPESGWPLAVVAGGGEWGHRRFPRAKSSGWPLPLPVPSAPVPASAIVPLGHLNGKTHSV